MLFKPSVIQDQCLPIELYEHEIPDLQDIGIVFVHEMSCLATADSVIVQFAARTARAGLPHFPEIILHASR